MRHGGQSLGILALLLASCRDEVRAREPVTIGAVLSVTGDLAAIASDFSDSMGLAVEEINSAGGVLGGRPLKLVVIDDQTLPAGSAAAHADLVARDVSVIIGPLFSAGVAEAATSIRSGGTVTISPSATSPALSNLDDGGLFFRTCPSDAVQGVVIARLVHAAAAQNVCIVFRQDSWGIGLSTVVKASLQSFDSAVTIVEAPYDPTLQDLSHVMEACEPVRTASAAAIVFMTYQADGKLIIDGATALGWSTATHKMFMCDGNMDQDLIDALADPSAMEGALGTAASGPDPEIPEGQRLREFRERFRNRFGRAPTYSFAESSYDDVYIAAILIELAASTDHVAIQDAVRRFSSGTKLEAGHWPEIKAAIAADDQVDYLGASGDVDIDLATGDLLPPFYIRVWHINGGTIETVRTETINP